MNVVVTGGTGFIGRPLCMTLSRDGHAVTLLTRRPAEAHHVFGRAVTVVEWNSRERGVWEKTLEAAEAVINLAGARLPMPAGPTARKRLLTDSRVSTTRLLVEALSRRSSKPRTLISASGIGYYGASDDRILDEGAVRGQGFLADLCLEWEADGVGGGIVRNSCRDLADRNGARTRRRCLAQDAVAVSAVRGRSDPAGHAVGLLDSSARSHRYDPVGACNVERLRSRQCRRSRGCDDEDVLRCPRTDASSSLLAAGAGVRAQGGSG